MGDKRCWCKAPPLAEEAIAAVIALRMFSPVGIDDDNLSFRLAAAENSGVAAVYGVPA